jgi:hypothetical protein
MNDVGGCKMAEMKEMYFGGILECDFSEDEEGDGIRRDFLIIIL